MRTVGEPAAGGARDTSAGTPDQVAHEIFEAVMARDPGGIGRFLAPEVDVDFVAVGEFHGRDEVRRYFEQLFAAFPDFTVAVDRIVSDEDTAVIQWHSTGTFRGQEFLGIRPTHRRVALKGLDIMGIHGGLVQAVTTYYDGASLARQIGMLPGRGSAGDRALLAFFNLRTRLAGLIIRH